MMTFDDFYATHAERVLRICYRKLPPENVEDMAQAFWLHAMTKFHGVREGHEQAWLNRVIRSMIARFYANRARRPFALSLDRMNDDEDAEGGSGRGGAPALEPVDPHTTEEIVETRADLRVASRVLNASKPGLRHGVLSYLAHTGHTNLTGRERIAMRRYRQKVEEAIA